MAGPDFCGAGAGQGRDRDRGRDRGRDGRQGRGQGGDRGRDEASPRGLWPWRRLLAFLGGWDQDVLLGLQKTFEIICSINRFFCSLFVTSASALHRWFVGLVPNAQAFLVIVY